MKKRSASKKLTPTKSLSASTIVIGRSGGSKINAVEGVVLSPEMRKLFRSFDKDGLSPNERRARLAARYGKKSA